jgi:hypothetical protein
VKSSTYHSATKKCTGKVIRQTNNMISTVLLSNLNLTLQWRWKFGWNVVLSVQVLVKAVGVKLLKVIGTETTAF